MRTAWARAQTIRHKVRSVVACLGWICHHQIALWHGLRLWLSRHSTRLASSTAAFAGECPSCWFNSIAALRNRTTSWAFRRRLQRRRRTPRHAESTIQETVRQCGWYGRGGNPPRAAVPEAWRRIPLSSGVSHVSGNRCDPTARPAVVWAEGRFGWGSRPSGNSGVRRPCRARSRFADPSHPFAAVCQSRS